MLVSGQNPEYSNCILIFMEQFELKQYMKFSKKC